MKTSLGHRPEPGKPWEFDAAVTECFLDMLERSIPDYQGMRLVVNRTVRQYAVKGTFIVDIGCSRGEAMAGVMSFLGDDVSYYGCDTSPPMVEVAKKRFIGHPNVLIEDRDITKGKLGQVAGNASVTLLVLTLQFLPAESRQAVLRTIYDATRPGGVLILVEKVTCESADIDAVVVADYYKMKRANGYSEEDITQKAKALSGVMVPATAKANEKMLTLAGFECEPIWRCLNFAAWVARKPNSV